jgi:hypothetical protein
MRAKAEEVELGSCLQELETVKTSFGYVMSELGKSD